MIIGILLVIAIGVGGYICYLLMEIIRNQKDLNNSLGNLARFTEAKDDFVKIEPYLKSIDEAVFDSANFNVITRTKLKHFVATCAKNEDGYSSFTEAGGVMKVPPYKALAMIQVLVRIRICSIQVDKVHFRIKADQIPEALKKIDQYFDGEIR